VRDSEVEGDVDGGVVEEDTEEDEDRRFRRIRRHRSHCCHRIYMRIPRKSQQSINMRATISPK